MTERIPASDRRWMAARKLTRALYAIASPRTRPYLSRAGRWVGTHLPRQWTEPDRLTPAPDGDPAEAATSPVYGSVDEPQPGATVGPARLTVRGWAACGDAPALAVAVVFGAPEPETVVVALGSEPRPDVADVYATAGLVDAGWRVELPLDYPLGTELPVDVFVWPGASDSPVHLQSVTVSVGEPESPPLEVQGALEVPAPGDAVGPSAVRVCGWTYCRLGTITRVDIVANGRPAGPARMGLPRPDVRAAFGDAGALVSGFEHLLDLAQVEIETGPLKIQAIAHLEGAGPQLVGETLVSVRTDFELPDRGARDEVLSERRRHLISGAGGADTSQLNLIVFTHRLDYGGAQLWLDELLARSGAGTDYACSVISPSDGPLRSDFESRGIPVHVSGEVCLTDPEAYEGRITEMSVLAADGPNVALVNTTVAFPGADVTTRLGIPTVWAIHESLSPPALLAAAYAAHPHPLVTKAAYRALSAADALVFEAHATRQLYERWAGPGAPLVVPYGIDTSSVVSYCERLDRTSAKSQLGLPEGRQVALVMGTFEPRKQQTQIIRAFEMAGRDYPYWDLALVGDFPSPYSDCLKDQLSHSSLADRVLVVPIVKDTFAWYRAADVLLSASDMESMPRSALEAMAFGLPYVAASVFGVPELITDGSNGFLFEPNDLHALAGGMRRVFSMESTQLRSVGENGRALVMERYDSSGYATEFRRLFRDLTDRHAEPRSGT